MAITIIQQPDIDKPNLLGNSLNFRLQTNNHIEQEAIYGYFKFNIQGSFPTNGKILKISFLHYQLEFTCNDNPNLENNEISNSIPGDNEAENWVNQISQELNQHPIISEFWEVITEGGSIVQGLQFAQIQFKAKIALDSLQILNVNAGEEYINLLAYDTQTGIKPQRRSKMYIQINYQKFTSTGSTRIIHSDRLVPDAEGNVDFNAADVFRKFAKTSIESDFQTTTLTSEDVHKFKIEYYERWGNDYFSAKEHTPSYQYMYGGIGTVLKGLYNDNNTNWYDELLIKKEFLTSRRRKSYAKIYQHLSFGFLTPKTEVTAKLSVVFSFENGVGIWKQYSMQMTPSEDLDFSFVRVNIGKILSQVAEEKLPDRVYKIRFKLLHPESQWYEVRILEDLEDGTEFIYRNTWGFYDSLILQGNESERLQFKKLEEIHHYKKEGYHTHERTISQGKNTSRQHFQCDTGFVSRDELTMLKEMLTSDDAFVVHNTLKIPIIVDRNSINIEDDALEQQQIKFKYSYAHEDQFPSNLDNFNL